MRTDYRIKKAHREAVLNRQRRFALIAAALVALSVWFASSIPFGAVKTEAADENYFYVSVQSGDTIWSIAKEYKPQGADLRAFARRIAIVNDVEDYVIYEGQALRIPD